MQSGRTLQQHFLAPSLEMDILNIFNNSQSRWHQRKKRLFIRFWSSSEVNVWSGDLSVWLINYMWNMKIIHRLWSFKVSLQCWFIKTRQWVPELNSNVWVRMCALWCRVNGEVEIMLSAGSQSRTGEFSKANQLERRGSQGREYIRVEDLVSCP